MKHHDVKTSLLPLRILVVSALYPPNIIGGAEQSAENTVRWLVKQGHEVAVLTTAASADDVVDGEIVDGIRMWRVQMPRPYAPIKFPTAPGWAKPIWHLQDHFDPRNRAIFRRVLRAFRPHTVNIQILQGLGYNGLSEIAALGLPTTYVVHDLGLACIRMSMFKEGQDCIKQCGACAMSSAWKRSRLAKIGRVGIISPSRANLDLLSKFFPVKDHNRAVILNPNHYPAPTGARQEADHVRILFVGRLHATKGIDLLLNVAERLAERHKIRLTVIGGGPLEQELRGRYASASWVEFTGFVSQSEISNRIVNSDVFCIPSIWAENSPGVVVHALSLGLPVIGSDRGGIPELVDAGRTGSLVTPGDCGAWERELEHVLRDPSILDAWRANALATATRFDQDTIGAQLLDFFHRIANTKLPPQSGASATF